MVEPLVRRAFALCVCRRFGPQAGLLRLRVTHNESHRANLKGLRIDEDGHSKPQLRSNEALNSKGLRRTGRKPYGWQQRSNEALNSKGLRTEDVGHVVDEYWFK